MSLVSQTRGLTAYSCCLPSKEDVISIGTEDLKYVVTPQNVCADTPGLGGALSSKAIYRFQVFPSERNCLFLQKETQVRRIWYFPAVVPY